MSYLEKLLPEFRKGAKIRKTDWKEGYFVYFECGDVWNTDNELVSFSGDDLTNDCWEFYQEPEPNWDYIIKNECLCYFWDDDEFSLIGTLIKIGAPETLYKDYKYKSYNGRYWKHCRPVRRDEVTFYEDRKDE